LRQLQLPLIRKKNLQLPLKEKNKRTVVCSTCPVLAGGSTKKDLVCFRYQEDWTKFVAIFFITPSDPK
jgi:hypothetical protein